jgi:sensor histidine kinase regulating citrate/malate metabolism
MLDVEFQFKGRKFIGNRLPVFANDVLVGAVSSFRPQDEIYELSDSLNKLQQYSELLRVQTHEYANRLHTISGLIQLDAKDEALDLIFKETSGYQDLIQYLAGAVKEPIIAGMIIGKYNRAKELGVTLNIDREGSLKEIPADIDQRDIVTIIGNLIDNAFDAAVSYRKKDAQVSLSFTDIGNDLVFEVEDNGEGISELRVEKIFEEGFTTKDETGHGLGLMIVMECLKRLKGEISIESKVSSGLTGSLYEQSQTVICVYIPKLPKDTSS